MNTVQIPARQCGSRKGIRIQGHQARPDRPGLDLTVSGHGSGLSTLAIDEMSQQNIIKCTNNKFKTEYRKS
jgi:hypothetical protein